MEIFIGIVISVGSAAFLATCGYVIKKVKAVGLAISSVGIIAQDLADHKSEQGVQRSQDRETMRCLLEMNRLQLRGQRTLLEASKGLINGNVDIALQEHRAMEAEFDRSLIDWATRETSVN